MKMNFSEQEIVSMIDFAMKNKGAPAQIANECETVSFRKLQHTYEVEVLTGLEEPLSLTKKKKQTANDGGSPTPSAGGVSTECAEEGCNNTFNQTDRRQKYCADHKRYRVGEEKE